MHAWHRVVIVLCQAIGFITLLAGMAWAFAMGSLWPLLICAAITYLWWQVALECLRQR